MDIKIPKKKKVKWTKEAHAIANTIDIMADWKCGEFHILNFIFLLISPESEQIECPDKRA